MTQLVRIGNSKGVRIPKALIKQADLEGKKLEFLLVSEGLLIAPKRNAREGWKNQIDQMINSQGQEPLDSEWLDFPMDSDDELEW